MCNHCDPKGWDRKCCNICGVGVPVYISISIAVPHGGDYPYSETDLCEKCWNEHGIKAAIKHNEQCREDLMKKQYDPLKVEKTDHPDLIGGIVWADCEREAW